MMSRQSLKVETQKIPGLLCLASEFLILSVCGVNGSVTHGTSTGIDVSLETLHLGLLRLHPLGW